MRFLVQLSLAFVAGLALGYLLLSIWDVIAPYLGALDPFDVPRAMVMQRLSR